MDRVFRFAVDARLRLPLQLLGVTQSSSSVRVGDDELAARFGFWSLHTPLANVAGAAVTGPYHLLRVTGVRVSLADRGLTFGSATGRGACLRFHQPVAVVDPTGHLRHPALTVTVEDPDALVAAVAAQTG